MHCLSHLLTWITFRRSAKEKQLIFFEASPFPEILAISPFNFSFLHFWIFLSFMFIALFKFFCCYNFSYVTYISFMNTDCVNSLTDTLEFVFLSKHMGCTAIFTQPLIFASIFCPDVLIFYSFSWFCLLFLFYKNRYMKHWILVVNQFNEK